MKQHLTRRAAAALALVALATAPVLAQTYPAKPVTLVVGFAPGGSADILARLIGQKLSASLGQQVVIENKPGAGATIATAAVAVNLGGDNTLLVSRKPEIMADAAHAIFASQKGEVTGQAFTDETALARVGITDLTHYACSPDHLDRLQKDFFLD